MTIAEIIPNIDVLRGLIGGATPAPGHAALREALASRYPMLVWRVGDYAETWFCPGKRVFAPDGIVIAEDRKTWLKGLLDAAGGDFVRVWHDHRGKGLATIEDEGHTVFAGAAIGPRPEDAIEIKMDWIVGARTEGVFASRCPQDADDLLSPCGHEEISWSAPVRPRYGLRRMNNIAGTLEQAEQLEQARSQEVARMHKVWVSEIHMDGSGQNLSPPYLKRVLRERRFVDDWAESSASATPFLAHWAFDVSDYEYKGERQLNCTPRPLTWADEIEWQEGRSLYLLMDRLERFDARIGHRMAWFFHAIYGNRLGPWAIRDVAAGLKRGKIGLPARDMAVIRRWTASEYGF